VYPNQFTPERILAMLSEGPPRIAEVTARLTPEQLRANPRPGEWSARDVLAHMRSCADVWGGCITRILNEDRPAFKAVNPTTWIKSTDYFELEFRPSLQAFTEQRAELLAVLESLPPESWLRAATVNVAGKPTERTVHFYAQWLARHERTHVRQITTIARAVQP
jgi:uncharacterized damage-inducible protein DinB